MKRRLLAFTLAIALVISITTAAGAQSNARTELQDLHNQLMAATTADEAAAINLKMQSLIESMEQNPTISDQLQRVQSRLDEKVAEKLAYDLANNERTDGEMSIQSTVRWDLLWRGDIMHVNNKKFFNLYAMYYSHTGMYDGGGLVYESLSEGVVLAPLSAWQQGNPVALGYNNQRTHSQRLQALNWAQAQYGTDGSTPYNWNYLDKHTDSSLYCSQLVWKMNMYLGDDLDSNDAGYAWFLYLRFGLTGLTFAYYAVAPDEIFLSPLATYFSVGTG